MGYSMICWDERGPVAGPGLLPALLLSVESDTVRIRPSAVYPSHRLIAFCNEARVRPVTWELKGYPAISSLLQCFSSSPAPTPLHPVWTPPFCPCHYGRDFSWGEGFRGIGCRCRVGPLAWRGNFPFSWRWMGWWPMGGSRRGLEGIRMDEEG